MSGTFTSQTIGETAAQVANQMRTRRKRPSITPVAGTSARHPVHPAGLQGQLNILIVWDPRPKKSAERLRATQRQRANGEAREFLQFVIGGFKASRKKKKSSGSGSGIGSFQNI